MRVSERRGHVGRGSREQIVRSGRLRTTNKTPDRNRKRGSQHGSSPSLTRRATSVRGFKRFILAYASGYFVSAMGRVFDRFRT